MAPRPPLAVAVTGGIGAGKSEALKAFARRGVPVLSSDEIVHRILREDDEVRLAILGRFGTLDRTAIAEIVFAKPHELAWLEHLLHPLVARENLAWRERLAQLPEPPAVSVSEIPLLYETGSEGRFDAVVVITAPPELRAARASGVFEQRSARLLPDEEKVRRADFAYVNAGSLEQLDKFVADVLASLTGGS